MELYEGRKQLLETQFLVIMDNKHQWEENMNRK